MRLWDLWSGGRNRSQVGLPIVFALLLNNFYIGKRIDDLRDQSGKRIDDLRDGTNKRFDDVGWRIDDLHKDVREIKGMVQAHDKDIAVLKEQSGGVKAQ